MQNLHTYANLVMCTRLRARNLICIRKNIQAARLQQTMRSKVAATKSRKVAATKSRTVAATKSRKAAVTMSRTVAATKAARLL